MDLWDTEYTQIKDVQIDVLTIETSALNDACKERPELSGVFNTFENGNLSHSQYHIKFQLL